MKLFRETACFSPSVRKDIPRAWVNDGGVVARSREEAKHAVFYFCNGLKDPWVQPLSARAIVAFDASWIEDSIKGRFCLPVGRYVLDEYLVDPVSIPQRDTSTSKDILASDPLSKKRPVRDSSSPETDSRPSKKQRIHECSTLPSRPAGKPVDGSDMTMKANRGDALLEKVAHREIRLPKRSEISGPTVRHLDLAVERARFLQSAQAPTRNRSLRFSSVPSRIESTLGTTLSRSEPADEDKKEEEAVIHCLTSSTKTPPVADGFTGPSNLTQQNSAQPSSLRPRISSTSHIGFLERMYDSSSLPPTSLSGPREPRHFSAASVLSALRCIPTHYACVFEPGKRHFGQVFTVLAID